MTGAALEGGCLCGRIRYRLAAVPTDVAHCHCRLCQRASGAAFVTWATAPLAEFTLLSGAPRAFRATAQAERQFCADCGTQLTFQADGADRIDITAASLDQPDRISPRANIWVGSRRAFVHGFDPALPDFDGEPATLD